MAFYFQLFWLPALASAVLLILAWIERDLSDVRALVLASWFLLALAAQYLAPSTGVWIVGLIAQTALAIGLMLTRSVSGVR
jgi:hypothetical protein